MVIWAIGKSGDKNGTYFTHKRDAMIAAYNLCRENALLYGDWQLTKISFRGAVTMDKFVDALNGKFDYANIERRIAVIRPKFTDRVKFSMAKDADPRVAANAELVMKILAEANAKGMA